MQMRVAGWASSGRGSNRGVRLVFPGLPLPSPKRPLDWTRGEILRDDELSMGFPCTCMQTSHSYRPQAAHCRPPSRNSTLLRRHGSPFCARDSVPSHRRAPQRQRQRGCTRDERMIAPEPDEHLTDCLGARYLFECEDPAWQTLLPANWNRWRPHFPPSLPFMRSVIEVRTRG